MSDERCRITDLRVGECAHCRTDLTVSGYDVERVETVGQPFEAKFDGKCYACERRINVGDRIARAADESKAYVHVPRCSA